MNCEIVGLSISESEGESIGLVTLKTPNGVLEYQTTPDEAKGFRIGQAMRLKLVRARPKAEDVVESQVAVDPDDDRHATLGDIQFDPPSLLTKAEKAQRKAG